jgi:hypothetical protein
MKKSLFLAAAVLAASGAQAQSTATANVNALAGIAPAMTLTCTDVNFGIWSVPAGDKGGATTITMTVNSADSATAIETVTPGGVTTVAQIGADSAGKCKVEGAWNALTASIGSSTGKVFTSSNHIVALGGVKLPTVANTGVVADLVLSTTTPSVNAASEAYFYVVGTLTIPNNLVAANYGGYRASTPAIVTVTQ